MNLALPVSRVWTIAPSQVPIDTMYTTAFQRGKGWGFDPDQPRGSGLWCVAKGKHKIYLDGPAGVTERVKPPVRKTQGFYMAGIPNTNEVLTPTMLALKVGAVNKGFIVQHSRTNPTHEPAFCEVKKLPVLLPLREVAVGEEFTYNYGYDKGENIPELEDSATATDAEDVVTDGKFDC